MSVDVSYHGVPLVKSGTARADGDAAFVETEAPMPVGTWLEVMTGGVSLRARVYRINEGTVPGMTLRFADGKTLPPEAFTCPPSEVTNETNVAAMMAHGGAEPNAPLAELPSEPTLVDVRPPVHEPPAERRTIEADASKREPTPEMVAEDSRNTVEMPVVSMEALPEDDGAGEGDEPAKDDGSGGGRRKKKRGRKTTLTGR
jgi:hypothetical protein